MLHNAGDCNISYRIYGKSGRPLVFLHGNGEDHLVFRQLIEYYQNSYRIIAVDTRGHGKSGRGNRPLDFNTLSDDIIGLIKETGADKPDIIGFSDGANTAVHIAIKAPDAIGKLVLIGGNINPSGMNAGTLFLLKVSRALKSFARIFRKSEKAEFGIELMDLMLKHPALTFSDLCKIKSRCLIIAGSRDMIRPQHTREIAASITGSRLVIINGNHFTALKQPKEAITAIDGFLNGAK